MKCVIILRKANTLNTAKPNAFNFLKIKRLTTITYSTLNIPAPGIGAGNYLRKSMDERGETQIPSACGMLEMQEQEGMTK